MALTRRTLLTAAAGAALASALPALGGEATLILGRAFGTSWQVRLRDDGVPDDLATELGAVLARVDQAMSPFRTDSEISRFNRAAAGRHEAGADFAVVTAEALRIARLTAGAFDPRVGPAVGRYGFGPIQGPRAERSGGIEVERNAIAKTEPLLTLDLCGIAKGYALDLMADRITGAGHRDFVVELGGEVLARGSDVDGATWRIGISDPGGGLHTVIDSGGLAVATSGDAVNAYEIAGRRYSHIIDPRTDEPVVNGVASATVLAPNAMTADGLATAMMVMGPAEGVGLADSLGLPVLYLVRASGGLREVASRAFDSHRLM